MAMTDSVGATGFNSGFQASVLDRFKDLLIVVIQRLLDCVVKVVPFHSNILPCPFPCQSLFDSRWYTSLSAAEFFLFLFLSFPPLPFPFPSPSGLGERGGRGDGGRGPRISTG